MGRPITATEGILDAFRLVLSETKARRVKTIDSGPCGTATWIVSTHLNPTEERITGKIIVICQDRQILDAVAAALRKQGHTVRPPEEIRLTRGRPYMGAIPGDSSTIIVTPAA